jgi:aryl-alcohol dehydrogenase-like predicted oxidoreductase
MVWSPLAGGLLSGKYALGADNKTEGEGRRGKIDFPRIDKQLAFDLVEAMRPMAEAAASRSRRSRSPGCCTRTWSRP